MVIIFRLSQSVFLSNGQGNRKKVCGYKRTHVFTTRLYDHRYSTLIEIERELEDLSHYAPGTDHLKSSFFFLVVQPKFEYHHRQEPEGMGEV